MRIGVSFPHHAMGLDPAAVRDWAQAADDLGIGHLIVYEHIILPDQALHPDEAFRYTHDTVLHEPLTPCSYPAAVTQRVGLQTGILVLPLHETVIVGKQLAEVDVLSAGRLRIGVGVGWLEFEFSALGRDFRSRGARMDEQIALLRGLWTGPSVTFHGREHHIGGAGINPLPVQRRLPVWVAGKVRATVRRAARYGDGWIVAGDYLRKPPDDDARQMMDWLHEEEDAAGRPVGSLGVQGVFSIGQKTEAEWAAGAEAWRQFGATDVLIDTGVSALSRDASLNTPGAQINALRRISDVLEPLRD
jgi:probable F420-dependent oxidoreductase